MFCNECGEKINDDVMNCPYCGNKIREPRVTVPIQPKKSTADISKIKKRFILIVVLTILVLSVFSYIGSSAGKLTQARIWMATKHYSKAYDVSCKSSGEKAYAYQGYALVMKNVEYLCDKANNNDEIDNSIAEIRNSINCLDDRKLLLRNREQTILDDISNALNSYDAALSEINTFRENINKACRVYDQFEYFDSGKSFNPSTIKAEAVEWQNTIDEANNYYKSIMHSEDLPFYSDIFRATKLAQSEMISSIDEFGENSTVYFKGGFNYSEKPCDTEDINKIVYEVKREYISRNFSDIYDVFPVTYSIPAQDYTITTENSSTTSSNSYQSSYSEYSTANQSTYNQNVDIIALWGVWNDIPGHEDYGERYGTIRFKENGQCEVVDKEDISYTYTYPYTYENGYVTLFDDDGKPELKMKCYFNTNRVNVFEMHITDIIEY